MIFLRLVTILLLALLLVVAAIMSVRDKDSDAYLLMYAADRGHLSTTDGDHIEAITPLEQYSFSGLVTSPLKESVAYVAYDGLGFRAAFGGCEPNIYAYNLTLGNQYVLKQPANCMTDTAFSEINSLTWSPDGQWLTYDYQPSYNTFTAQVIVPPRQIYRVRVDGSGHQALTNEAGDQIQPAWSPDGDWIAYISQSDVGSATGYLMRMHPNGSQKERLLPDLGQFAAPVWSPNGQWLYFRANIADAWNIYRLNLPTGFTEPVTAMRGNPRQMAISPDGDTIAFIAGNDAKAEVYMMHSDGGDLRQITHNKFEDGSPVWSPNQKWLAYTSLRGQNRRLFIINPDGANERLIASARDYFSMSPVWLPMPALKWNPTIFPLIGFGYTVIVIIVIAFRHHRPATFPPALRIG